MIARKPLILLAFGVNPISPLVPTCIDKKDAGKNPALERNFVRKFLSKLLSRQPRVIKMQGN